MDRQSLLLMAVTTEPGGTDELIARARAAVRGGATSVQLRAKRLDARRMAALARALVQAVPVPVIVNDRLDVALAAGAAGVHLGPDDLPVAEARRIAPAGFLIGASVGSDAEVAGAAGADYVGVGPVYASATKVDAGDPIGITELTRLIDACGLPGVGVGGITPSNALEVIAAGAAGVAAVSSLFGAADVESAARSYRSAIGK